jgi:hypothetical protein
MNALKSLKRLNYLNPSAASTLLNDAAYGNNRLNPVVNEVISYFYEQNNYRKMLKDEFNKLDASKKDKLKDIIK